MFDWLKKDPIKKLQSAYHDKLEQAMHAQRKGDIRLHGQLTAEAEQIRTDILVLEQGTIRKSA